MQPARINKTSCCKFFLKSRDVILRPYGPHLMSSVLIRIQGCSLVSVCVAIWLHRVKDSEYAECHSKGLTAKLTV